MLSVSLTFAQDFKVLLVDDDNNTDEIAQVKTAVNNSGYTYSVDTAYNTVPSYQDMEQYDMVLWYTGNDGTTNLWQADANQNSTYINALRQFAKNGGIVWVDGLDFLYDIVGAAPDTFPDGSFIKDTLGISDYLSQSYADDGGAGVPQYDICTGNTITSLDPVTWTYSTLHYADGLAITADAHALYKMYDDSSYPLRGQITALYNQVGNGTYITSGFRLAKINNQANTDLLVSNILDYAANNWDTEANSIAPTSAQNISVGSDGTALTVTESVGWDSREWQYSTTSGSGYVAFSTPETGKTYTPNFATAGTYYVVCYTSFGAITTQSNEVQINVVDLSNSISPTDNQYILTGTNGTQLTVTESTTPDNREWKYSTTSGSGYISFSTPETGTTYTPNFSTKGTYYVVCQSNFGGTIITSNEVKVVVDTNASNSYLAFDGDDSFYIKDNNQDYINISDNYTIETWVKIDSYTAGTYPVIMDRDKCFSLYVQADATDDFSIAFARRDATDAITASLSSADNAGVSFNFGDWYHIAVTYNGTDAKMFINGIEVVTNNTDDFTLLAAATDYINVGCRYRSGYERYLSGSIENIQISDIQRYTNSFTPDFYAQQIADDNSVVCLNLENNGGTNLYDFSGHFSNIHLRNSPNDAEWKIKAQNAVTPSDVQNIVQNQDGNVLTVNENGLATSREWKYSTTSGSGYVSFSPAQTETTYTPNFANTGTYYVVCVSNFNGTEITSNEVQINVQEAATITLGTISGSPFYVSDSDAASLDVPYTITGTFNSGNVFTAYLSDETGDFTNEVAIGTYSSTTDGTINASIPAGTPSGTAYRIIVKSSDPIVVSDTSSNFEVINVSNSVTPPDAQYFDVGQTGNTLTVSETPTADSREWLFSTTSGGPYYSFSTPETGTTYTPTFDQVGTYYVVCKSYFNGGTVSAMSNEVQINVQTAFKVLLVDDDDYGVESAPIDTALAHSGYSYFKIATTDSIPSLATLQQYDMVLWYTGNDGITNLWDADSTYIDQLETYVSDGGLLWVDGLDFIYDIYGTAHDDFSQGDFIYDKLGISNYLDQSYADDGGQGVPQMDITPENKVTTLNPVTWIYSTLWNADGLQITNSAIPLYVFGDSTYQFAGQVNSLYRQENFGTYLTTGLRITKLANQSDIDTIVLDVINYAQQTPAVYCGNLDETSYYVTATNGATIKIPYSIDGGFDFNSDNVFTAYLSDETGDFANEVAIGSLNYTAGDTIIATIPAGTIPGTAYRVRVKASNPALTSNDNGVDITIISATVEITPTDEQTFYIGQTGTELTVSETPTADSREWKYSTTQGSGYISFTPAQTGTTYTPSFGVAGTYYVVCQSNINNSIITSNEVIINVLNSEITTGAITGSPFVVTSTTGTDVDVPYTISGFFNTGNIFTAYLSDATGDFTNEVAIGTYSSTTDGTITTQIPAGTASGNAYRIRVKSDNPVVVGTDNGTDLIIENQTDINNLSNSEIQIYPNPASDIIYFDIDNIRNTNVKIIDNLGRIIISETLNSNSINISNLQSGIYNVIIIQNGEIKISHIIKI